jgi:hypothetical protein
MDGSSPVSGLTHLPLWHFDAEWKEPSTSSSQRMFKILR